MSCPGRAEMTHVKRLSPNGFVAMVLKDESNRSANHDEGQTVEDAITPVPVVQMAVRDQQLSDARHTDEARLYGRRRIRPKLGSGGMASRNTLLNLVSGIGESDQPVSSSRSVPGGKKLWPQAKTSSSYLLLDVRAPQQFQKCHITGAVNCPYTVLSVGRAGEPPELIAFKHQPTMPIICYDFEDRHGATAARILVERGYHNVHVLNGGLKQVVRLYPKGLVAGNTIDEVLAMRTKRSQSVGVYRRKSRASAVPMYSRCCLVGSLAPSRPASEFHVCPSSGVKRAFTKDDLLDLHKQFLANNRSCMTSSQFDHEALPVILKRLKIDDRHGPVHQKPWH